MQCRTSDKKALTEFTKRVDVRVTELSEGGKQGGAGEGGMAVVITVSVPRLKVLSTTTKKGGGREETSQEQFLQIIKIIKDEDSDYVHK